MKKAVEGYRKRKESFSYIYIYYAEVKLTIEVPILPKIIVKVTILRAEVTISTSSATLQRRIHKCVPNF